MAAKVRGAKQQRNTKKAKPARRRKPVKAANAKARKKKKLPPALEANLWKPGQSGNPNGRPKSPLSLTKLLREHLEKPASTYEPVARIAAKMGMAVDGRTVGDVLVLSIALHAVSSDRGAHAQIVMDRIDGSTKHGVGRSSDEQAADVRAYLADAVDSVDDE
jgi:hypothetical protein